MSILATRRLTLGLAVLASACSPPSSDCPAGFAPGSANGTAGQGCILGDADGDGISDLDEGRFSGIDTDGDGLPDFQDTDADADGLADRDEAGDGDINTPPFDADGDGTPNFRDLDSDDNGLPDNALGTENLSDLDSDAIPNFADTDDDGDGLNDVVEIGGAAAPADTDGDQAADFQDRDADGDSILDLHEQLSDNDTDGLPAYVDLDADGDCIADVLEAGDADPESPPRDTDDDGVPDFLDTDADGDGLDDGLEDLDCNGLLDPGETSSTLWDTDGDGVSDGLEIAAGTAPDDPADNPASHGQLAFELPYMEAAHPTAGTLDFATRIQSVDLYFAFDTAGNMLAELDAMRSLSEGVPALVADLECPPIGGACTDDADCAEGVCFGQQCIEDPADNGCLPELWTGVGAFAQLDTFTHLLTPQSDPVLTAMSVPMNDGSGHANPMQALLCAAESGHCLVPPSCVAGADTCVGFRDDAFRVIVQMTDASDECTGTRCGLFTPSHAASLLDDKQIQFVGLFGADNSPTPPAVTEAMLIDVALASGSVGFWGQPLVYPALGANVVTQVRDALRATIDGSRLDVTITAEDLPGDDGDALQFIEYLEVNTSGHGNCTASLETADQDGDGRDDSFPTLLAGTPVCWDIHPVPSNTTVAPVGEPAVFRASLTVRGNGTELDRRTVLFLVPPL